MQGGDHAEHEEDQRQRHIGTRIAELRVEEGGLPLHRNRHLLVADPFENVEHGKRIGEHCQREVVSAQAEGRHSDHDAGNDPDNDAERNADPGRDAEGDEQDGHRIAA